MAEVCHVVRYASTVLNFVDRSSSREAPTMRGVEIALFGMADI